MATQEPELLTPVRWHTALELGVIIREARGARGWTQAELAGRAGVGRQWLVAMERGRHSRAEIGLVLRVLSVLGVELSARLPSDGAGQQAAPEPDPATRPFDLDDVFSSLASDG
jgi:HTH-type transcriptional regulator / antitoxin HipB